MYCINVYYNQLLLGEGPYYGKMYCLLEQLQYYFLFLYLLIPKGGGVLNLHSPKLMCLIYDYVRLNIHESRIIESKEK